MKRRHLTCLLLAILLIGGCAGEIRKDSPVPQATETPTAEINTEVRPGVHMSNDPADFPFPTSGYDVYLVGETHGNPQTKQIFQAYVKTREAPTATQTSVVEVLQEVRPGIYMSNDPVDFPFPTSGYDVYIVGETHGNQEANRSFRPISKYCMVMRVYEM